MSKKKETVLDVFKSHGVRYNSLPDFVYGGIDGAVTTFAVVAAVEGATLSGSIILILGFANLFADGFSMAVGKYSSAKAELQTYNKIKAMEYAHLKEKPEHEREEVREIMAGYGFKGKDLDRAVEIITSNEEAWVDLMMRNEFNLTQENVEPMKGALATFFSFLLIGFIPLFGYVVNLFFDFYREQVFIFTICFTLLALFIVGAIRGKFTDKYWLVSGLEIMFIGGFAAAISYVVGFWLKSLGA